MWVTLLCLTAVTTVAYEESPLRAALRKTVEPWRDNAPKPNFPLRPNRHGVHMLNSEVPPMEDSTTNHKRSGKCENIQGSVACRRPDDARRAVGTEINRMKLRNKGVTNYTGRGLLTNMAGCLMCRIGDAVKKTTDMTRDLVKGSIKLTEDVAQNTAKLSKDIIKGTLNVTKKAIVGLTTKTIQIGKMVVEAPLRGIEVTVNAAWAAHTFGTGLTAQIISDSADWFQGNWEAVKAMEFPGKSLVVLLYPSGLLSVVNTMTKEIMYMIDKGHKALTHAFAYTLYISLKIVLNSVNSAIKISRLNCVKLRPQKMKVNEKLIETIATKSGKVCGIAHLNPVNNVTIIRNEKNLLTVEIPWVLGHLSIHMTGVKVKGMGILGKILDNEVMDIKTEKVKAKGTVSFEAGTILRFIKTRIRVDSIEGLSANFPKEEKSWWMESIESLSGSLSPLVTKELNNVLTKIEKKVFDYIAHM